MPPLRPSSLPVALGRLMQTRPWQNARQVMSEDTWEPRGDTALLPAPPAHSPAGPCQLRVLHPGSPLPGWSPSLPRPGNSARVPWGGWARCGGLLSPRRGWGVGMRQRSRSSLSAHTLFSGFLPASDWAPKRNSGQGYKQRLMRHSHELRKSDGQPGQSSGPPVLPPMQAGVPRSALFLLSRAPGPGAASPRTAFPGEQPTSRPHRG